MNNKFNRIVSPPVECFDDLRQPLTKGERMVFDLFNRCLSPEWEIYIQPHLNGLRPDFVLLNPNVGIAVFEVKDWNLSAMNYGVEERGESHPPLMWGEKDGEQFSIQKDNPVEKVYRYKNEIFNLYCPRLKKNFGFSAITSGIIFPFCPDDRVMQFLKPCLEYRGMARFPEYNPVSGSNSILSFDIKKIFPESTRSMSKLMSEDLIKDLRAWLVEPDAAVTQRQPLNLDKNQLSLVLSRTQSGYRRIKGAAGSGKSLVLASRAAELLKQDKDVLVVTFNITLINYLKDIAVRYPLNSKKVRSDVTWLNFHAWCKRVCIENDRENKYYEIINGGGSRDVFNEGLPKLVSLILDGEDNCINKYDAVLVDEAQDFLPSWWNVLRKVCKPGGEMLLVADETQDIYGTAGSWTDEAMSGAGFSGKWSELEVSYRMPEQALNEAVRFAAKYLPETKRIIPKSYRDKNMALLDSCYLRWVHCEEHDAAQICCDEIIGVFSKSKSDALSVSDATFLCDKKGFGHRVVEILGGYGIRCVHTFDEDDRESRRQKVGFYMGDARVKATTLHSFKGWESKALILYMGKDLRPASLALLYTGLTRLKTSSEGSFLTVISTSLELREFGKSWPDFVEIN